MRSTSCLASVSTSTTQNWPTGSLGTNLQTSKWKSFMQRSWFMRWCLMIKQTQTLSCIIAMFCFACLLCERLWTRNPRDESNLNTIVLIKLLDVQFVQYVSVTITIAPYPVLFKTSHLLAPWICSHQGWVGKLRDWCWCRPQERVTKDSEKWWRA